MQRFVVYDDQDGQKKIPVATAVAIQRYTAATRKFYYYLNDEEALQDFMTVHWAWIVEEN